MLSPSTTEPMNRTLQDGSEGPMDFSILILSQNIIAPGLFLQVEHQSAGASHLFFTHLLKIY